MQPSVVLRRGLIVACCLAITACSSPSTGNAPVDGELSPQFLDMLAPIDGDSGSRADETASLLLAQAEVDAVRECMQDAGFANHADLPVRTARDRNSAHAEYVSPAKLESRGLVAMGDPALDEVPMEVQAALSTCLGATGEGSVSEATDRFVVFRDGAENPVGNWPDILRTEVGRLAESDGPETIAYRDCFRQLGVPADVARNPMDAGSFLIMDMNERTNDFSPARVEAWRRGDAVLDGDGGALARSAAACYREFEALLRPRLEELRDAALEEHRERLLEGQQLFYEAIGSNSFDPDSYDF